MKTNRFELVISFVVPVLLASCATNKPTAPFPKQLGQIDSTTLSLGTGSCSTTRSGTWMAEGGIVLEIQQPKDCKFETLELIVAGERIPLTTVDENFIQSKIFNGAIYVPAYTWHGNSGKLFFNTPRKINVSDIQGILEPKCQSHNCLNEAKALAAVK